MLRITDVSRDPHVATLSLDGRIAGQWVDVLEGECRRHLDAGRRVELDFTRVSSIDRQGVAMLRRLRGSRLRLLNAEPFVEALLREDV